ncbi:MAG TPA: alpha/beta hydrolase [Solimonas sp.]
MPTPASVRSGRFSFGPYELGYEVYGESGIPCVLVHGILLDSLMNRDLALRFAAAGYQVALLDLLGHGHSSRPTDPKLYRTEFFADQLLALMDHLGWEKALIGGVSLGCITSLTVAARAPQRVLGLYLEMPVMEWSAPWAAVILAPMLAITRFGRPLYTPFARWLSRRKRPSFGPAASAMNALSNNPKTITAILHGTLVGPIVPPIAARRALQMPALVIGHVGDKLHHNLDAAGLAKQLPNARLLDARSILELRLRPARLWPEIERFLLDVAATQQSEPATRRASPRKARASSGSRRS